MKLRSDQLRDQNNKIRRLLRKYDGPVEVIHKIGKVSYRIHLLPWMRTSPVVHVSNMKHYSSEVKDIKHREGTWPHIKKKNPKAKDAEETLTEETLRADEPRISFQNLLTELTRLRNTEISWKHIEKT